MESLRAATQGQRAPRAVAKRTPGAWRALAGGLWGHRPCCGIVVTWPRRWPWPNLALGWADPENAPRFPAPETKVPLESLSIPNRGQRLPGRARIACQGAGRRWPVAFGATAGMVNRAQHDQGDGLGQAHRRIGRTLKTHRVFPPTAIGLWQRVHPHSHHRPAPARRV